VCEAFSKDAGAVMQQQSENKQLLRECRQLPLATQLQRQQQARPWRSCCAQPAAAAAAAERSPAALRPRPQ
jgi:hypothetical protein